MSVGVHALYKRMGMLLPRADGVGEKSVLFGRHAHDGGIV